jgi:hypothetical protein
MLFQEDENQTSTNQQKNNQHQHHCAKFNALAGLKKVIPAAYAMMSRSDFPRVNRDDRFELSFVA